MKVKVPYGSTADNNLLTLPVGMLSVDLTKKAIRIHDGATQGGFEVLGTQAWFPPYSGPGPQTLAFGTLTKGFYGECPASSLITGSALATAMSLSAGTDINSGEPWLKFALNNKVLYVSRKLLRSNVSWNQLNTAGVISGTKTWNSGNSHTDAFKVRLLKGAASNPASPNPGIDSVGSLGSEWNKLMYHVCDGLAAGEVFTSEGISHGDWASYSLATLGASLYTWCQEPLSDIPTNNVVRGGATVGNYTYIGGANPNTDRGWRPVLEWTGSPL